MKTRLGRAVDVALWTMFAWGFLSLGAQLVVGALWAAAEPTGLAGIVLGTLLLGVGALEIGRRALHGAREALSAPYF